MQDTPKSEGHGHAIGSNKQLAVLSLGALGVVYGDIGTSPLYAMKECFLPGHGLEPTQANVLGIVSLIFWSLVLTVVVKYLTFVMRADNHGEGGVLALLALLKPAGGCGPRRGYGWLTVAALFGAALLYGDGMITPALSVLSAVEGLEVATTAMQRFVLPITVGILVGLFLAQSRGTAKIGLVFGPTMLAWFATIGAMGVPWVIENPSVLRALNPVHGAHIFIDHRMHGFLILGSVVLCITGGEALYADMGHYGSKPIRLAWYAVVFPALVTNYMGQGALLLAHPEARNHPFFHMTSGPILYPIVALATVATVVASQALISGAFSLTQQAIQLGYWPRVTIVHTSGESEGQIYIPEINHMLMVACVALVLGFQTSTAMASAYGIAVTGTMGVTSVLFYAVARTKWNWSRLRAGLLSASFLLVDMAFFFANLVKLRESRGGLFPLFVGLLFLLIMLTWKRGRDVLYAKIKEQTRPVDAFLAGLASHPPHRVAGTAVFMTSNPDGVPPVLHHHLLHNKVLHEQVILLSLLTVHRPDVPREERINRVNSLGHGIFQVTAKYGFMQTPNVEDVIALCAQHNIQVDHGDTSFFLGRETLLVTKAPTMAPWRKMLFVFLSKNARPANAFFRIAPTRVIELGTQVEL